MNIQKLLVTIKFIELTNRPFYTSTAAKASVKLRVEAVPGDDGKDH